MSKKSFKKYITVKLTPKEISERMRGPVRDLHTQICRLTDQKKELTDSIKALKNTYDHHVISCSIGSEEVEMEVYARIDYEDCKTYFHSADSGECVFVRQATDDELQSLPNL